MSKRLLKAEDLLSLNLVGDPQVSPKKDRVAYVLTKLDIVKDGYYSSIYVSEFEGQSQQLTYYESDKLIKDKSPKWSPNGEQLAFLSNRTGSTQVWMLPVEGGGEAIPVTSIDGNIQEFAWSPDATKLLLTVEETINSKNKSDIKEITRLRYKADGIRDFLESRKHIFLFDIHTNGYTKITEGDFDFYGAIFSPNGKELVYLGSREGAQEIEYVPSIWRFNIENNEEKLLYQGSGPIRSLAYSPDGLWVGFIGHEHGETSSANLNVWAVSIETTSARNLTSILDRTVDNPVRVDAAYDTGQPRIVWDQNSTSIFFTATDRGSIQLYKTNLDGEVSKPLSEDQHTITSFAMIDDHHAVFVQAHCHSTGDLVIQNIDKIDEKKNLTTWNDPLFTQIQLSTPEHITVTSEDGLEIEGWILHPVRISKEAKHPLVLQIHGGPHSAYGYGFQHEWQLMAAKGYAVLYTNPRGSQGYGEDFLRRVVGDWGGEDYKDLMTAVDYVLDTFSYIDQEQLFVTGASYGGYMTNMITARTNRFKAAATQNSVTNLYSMFGTSDIGFYFNSAQLGGADMWDDEETVMKFSPIRYAKNVKTPTLILHNEDDYRCPMEQAEQWYIALRRLGVDTKFLRFPNENHGIASKGKPTHRLERLRHLIEWFENYRLNHSNESIVQTSATNA
ncbi:S9 family peptidase [Bacillus sp. V33-4]|uniref:S9 family peptidase n=1 Tax=Bacillus sp. V33-4 TaxID=2054169 RepID=UPI000C78C6C3|nr:S9 family peptidase [Bacillus sp. V33-4]PLR81477.1 S9 family peptidase [Bacillus sp. V33-4]